jgi:CHRD domain
MTRNKSMHLILVAGALLSLVIVSTMNPNSALALGFKFKAKLKGESEVPPVNTTATGKARFKVNEDAITSKINITGITDVTMAHIHQGLNGQNGDPVVDLLKTGKQEKAEGGVLIKGEIKDSDLQGPMAGKMLYDLRTAMNNGETYVNIHTSDHKDGEIRGQIKVNVGNATNATSLDANSTSGTEDDTDTQTESALVTPMRN